MKMGKFGCLKLHDWAIIIGVLDFGFFSFQGGYSIAALFMAISKAWSNPIEETNQTAILAWFLLLMFDILGCIAAVVLLRGLHYRNPPQLQYWIIFALYTSVGLSVWLTIDALIFGRSRTVKIRNSAMFLRGPFQVFGAWIVSTHRQEILAKFSASAPSPC